MRRVCRSRNRFGCSLDHALEEVKRMEQTAPGSHEGVNGLTTQRDTIRTRDGAGGETVTTAQETSSTAQDGTGSETFTTEQVSGGTTVKTAQETSSTAQDKAGDDTSSTGSSLSSVSPTAAPSIHHPKRAARRPARTLRGRAYRTLSGVGAQSSFN